MLKPLEEWICDECGEVIQGAENGYLEFLSDQDHRPFEIRLVHTVPASPRQRGDGCFAHTEDLRRGDVPLIDFVGPDGLVHLLSLIDYGPVLQGPGELRPGVRDSSWTEAVRRLHVPHYEDARQYFASAKANGEYADHNEYSPYRQECLQRVIDEYEED